MDTSQPIRKRCKFVYCRAMFTTTNHLQKYCCHEHCLAQQKYVMRKRYAEKYKTETEE